jgi:hypothetical protein
MRALLLIYSPESHYLDLPPDALRELTGEWARFHAAITAAGIVHAAERLRPSASARTLRVRAGRPATTDGPFAETKEQLGGFYLVDVPDRAAALAWAARMPSARVGAIEVRPLDACNR